MKTNWLDRAVMQIAPRYGLRRVRARMAVELALRSYDGAAVGRRTQGWRRSSTDSTQATGPFIGRLRDTARDLVRNNPYAESALSTIVNHTVGWGIVPESAPKLWDDWAGTTACDADGRHNFYGLQRLAMRTIAESGGVIVRRRLRKPEDGLPIPLQIQVLEPDFIDTSRDSLGFASGGTGNRIIQGVEFDGIGRRVAYWLYKEHPGSQFATTESVRVPAVNVQYPFRTLRAGQVHGVTWFAPTMLRFKDLDEFEDATLMKQKIAACLAVFVTDVDGSAAPLGQTDTTQDPQIDSLEPGMVNNLPPGRSVTVVEPPSVRDYADYTKALLRSIATGLGVTYEDLTGDYGDMPFSAARMSRLSHWDNVNDWRWQLIIPQFCDPVWGWFAEVAGVFGTNVGPVEWTAAPAPMIDPVNEGLAYQRNIRTGIQSLSDALRERGYNPVKVLNQIAGDNKLLDKLGLILDSDPRHMTQAGQWQQDPAVAQKAAEKLAAKQPKPALPAAADDEEDDEDEMDAVARKLRAMAVRR